MKKRSKPTLDAREWARGKKMGQGGMRCRLCAAAPAVGKDLAVIVEMKAKGETEASYPQVREFLKQKHGLDIVDSSLCRHIREHMRMPWATK